MSKQISAAAAAGLAAFVLLAPGALSPALADGARSLSCVGGYGAFSCVRSWRDKPKDPYVIKVDAQNAEARDAAESMERERRWVARCKPTLRQDRYGVSRYAYAAPGCEFGKYE